MKLTYHVFLRSKTVDSDWSFFVLPENFIRAKKLRERLLEIITDIYRDDEIRNVTQKEDAFYCFPLNSHLICMRLWRPNFNDISGRPIWTFAGIVVDLSQTLLFKGVLPELISNSYIFDKIEADYMNYRGAVPFPPETSSAQTLNATVCGQPDELQDEQKQNPEKRETSTLSSNIVSFPFNTTGRHELINLLKMQAEECSSPLEFFVFGPGFQTFIQEKVVGLNQSRPVKAKLKSNFVPSKEAWRYLEKREEQKRRATRGTREFESSSHEQENLLKQQKEPPHPRDLKIEQEKKSQTRWEYCRVYNTQMRVLGFGISRGPRYIAETTGHYGRKTRVAEDDDLLKLGLKLENDGWTPRENSNWRVTGKFPSKWEKAFPHD